MRVRILRRKINALVDEIVGECRIMENGLAIYGTFIKEIKDLIYRRQYEAMKKVNAELLQLY